MPWKDCSVMDERIRFVARLLDGETMALLCREFDISRKTGYKIFDRYKECGLEGLTDRTRRPYRYGNQLPLQVETYILTLKQEHPIGERARSASNCCAAFPARSIPAKSTIHAVLDRHGRSNAAAPARTRPGHPFIAGAATQRTLVHRLQRRVPVGQSEILLSADRHRSRHPVSASL